jgi:DNA-binding NtrC family response regulator
MILADPTAEAPCLSSPQFRLEWPGGVLPLDGAISVGQAGDNRVTLRDPLVSRHHCIFETTADGLVLRDLGSKNGTFVNGVRAHAVRLHGPATIALGATRMRVAVVRCAEILLGDSEPMRRLRQQVAVLATTRLPVLVLGETGTGKELVAQSLHKESGRAGAFVPVNCGAIPKELVESELFGHERGAFTGAALKRPGVFQEAHEGTLFLDEIGELGLPLQSRLLRALESGVVRPVGADREVRVDVRVVAATHIDLRRAVEEGRFRQDLYYRLAAAIVSTPPLRRHADDIPRIADHILGELAEELGGCELTNDARERLRLHPWPGNVRELKNVLRRAATLRGPLIRAEDLELGEPRLQPGEEEIIRLEGRSLTEIERDVISRALTRSNGSRRQAAQLLQIPKSTLCDKIRRYGL